jgi:hypothetical protein
MVATQDVDMALMPDVEDESTEPETLADRHDSVDVDSEHIQATFEYTITIPQSKLDELPEEKPAEGFACHLACLQAEEEYDLTFSVHDAIAQEDDHHVVPDEERFTVLVRVSQNR